MKSLIKNIQYNSSRTFNTQIKFKLNILRNIFNVPFNQRLFHIPRTHFSQLKNSSSNKVEEINENKEFLDSIPITENTDATSSSPKELKVNNNEEKSQSKEKQSFIDEIENTKEVEKEEEEEVTSFAIDEIEKDDAEYKYVYKTINSRRSTLKNLLKRSEKNSSFFRENLMFVKTINFRSQ
jgi:hypothetical protein